MSSDNLEGFIIFFQIDFFEDQANHYNFRIYSL